MRQPFLPRCSGALRLGRPPERHQDEGFQRVSRSSAFAALRSLLSIVFNDRILVRLGFFLTQRTPRIEKLAGSLRLDVSPAAGPAAALRSSPLKESKSRDSSHFTLLCVTQVNHVRIHVNLKIANENVNPRFEVTLLCFCAGEG